LDAGELTPAAQLAAASAAVLLTTLGTNRLFVLENGAFAW